MNKEIYDRQGNLLENPDMELGWLKPSARTVHHDAVEYVPDQFHYEGGHTTKSVHRLTKRLFK